MQGKSLLPLVIACGIAAFCLYVRPGDDGGRRPPPAPIGPDLTAAFATGNDPAEAAEHAHIFGTLCASLADCLEYDGSRSEPLLKTGVQIDELRRGVRQTRMRGWSFMAKYPGLAPAVESFLTAEVGTSGGPVSPEQRAKWISALRQLAAAAEYAAGR